MAASKINGSDARGSRVPARPSANSTYDSLALDRDRNNSYIRRTVTRTTNVATKSSLARHDVSNPDFINLITAVEELYAQRDVMEMQQLDGHRRTQVGKGGVMDVSTVNAESTLPSETTANEIVRHGHEVIVKRPPTRLFDANGLSRPDIEGAAAKFVMELRILSNPFIRTQENVIKLLGIGWEYTRSDLTAPEPNLILERAQSTLYSFQKKYPALPFETKRLISLDIAKGLSALHQCGVVHGDVKTDNVLMIESTRWIAKIADFSHSVLVTNNDEFLPGGTRPFNAPEWRDKLPAAKLFKTDVFSFGLVLSCVLVGRDIFDEFCKSRRNGRNYEEFLENFEIMKRSSALQEYIIDLLYEVDDTDLASRREDIASTKALLSLTLQAEPGERNLLDVIEKLTKNEIRQQHIKPETVISRLDANTIAVPYQALNTTSQVLKSHIVTALETIANKEDEDDRSPTACYELCACYISGFGTAIDHQKATFWLLRACEMGQAWARSTVHRLLEAMQESCPSEKVEQWLYSAVQEGSLMALESLSERNSPRYYEALGAYRNFTTKSAGPPELQWTKVMAIIDGYSRGDDISLGLIGKLEDKLNDNGDTILICACRAGKHQVAHRLLDIGADARTCNRLGENALHLLTCLDTKEVPTMAERLFKENVDWTQEASSSSIPCSLEQRPMIPGCPMVRAVFMNRPRILEVLFRLEKSHELYSSTRQKKIRDANIKKMLALACRQCNIDILEVIKTERSYLWSHDMESLGFWIDERRYSLSALAIAGCVSDRATSGFNVPERFWRCHSHGRLHLENLLRTLRILGGAGIDFNMTPCGGESNALFFAIRHGRADAVNILLAESDNGNMFEAFGLGVTQDFDAADGVLRDEGTRLPNHGQKSTLIDAIDLSIERGHRDIFRTLLKTRNHEALEMGITYPIVYSQVKVWWMKDFDKKRWTLAELLFPEPEDMRRVFPKVPNKVYKYKDCMRRSLRFRTHDHYFVSDGRLNYPLRYMVSIAMSLHRDIQLAQILLEELKDFGKHCDYGWVPRDYFEACCLGKGKVIRSPLEIAATELWPNLVQLLIENGADPRAKIYCDMKWAANETSGFDKMSFGAKIFLTEENPPLRRSILSYLLGIDITSEELDSNLNRQLQGARHLYAKSKYLANRLLPRTVEELHVFLITSTRVSQISESKLDEDVAELWSTLTSEYSSLPALPRDRMDGLVFMSAFKSNVSALKCFLQLGFSPNGKWWQRILMTPYDTVRCKPRKEMQAAETVQCLKLLKERGASRGPIFLLEFQLLFTIGIIVIDVLIVSVANSVLSWGHGAGQALMSWLNQYLTSGLSTWAFNWTIVGLIFAANIYFVFVLFLLSITTSPVSAIIGWFTLSYLSKPSFPSLLLHLSPLVICLTFWLYDSDVEAVKYHVYGPTVSILKMAFGSRKDHCMDSQIPHASIEILEDPFPYAQPSHLSTISGSPSDSQFVNDEQRFLDDEEAVTSMSAQERISIAKRRESGKHTLRWLVNTIIKQPLSFFNSASDRAEYISQGFRLRRTGNHHRGPRYQYDQEDDDDDEAWRSLLSNADEESDVYD